MKFDIEDEKKRYLTSVKITRDIYSNDDKITKRSRIIFTTFARTLNGRSAFPKLLIETEKENLLRKVIKDIIHPILRTPSKIANSQLLFDEWHRNILFKLRRECPISWRGGTELTVGMAQKIVNLHCKDMWALGLASEKYSRFFHPIIDRVTLDFLGKKCPWTHLDSYEKYMKLQFDFRQRARDAGIQPLALECYIWNNKPGKQVLFFRS